MNIITRKDKRLIDHVLDPLLYWFYYDYYFLFKIMWNLIHFLNFEIFFFLKILKHLVHRKVLINRALTCTILFKEIFQKNFGGNVNSKNYKEIYSKTKEIPLLRIFWNYFFKFIVNQIEQMLSVLIFIKLLQK